MTAESVTGDRRRIGARRRGPVLVALAVAALVLAGCSLISGVINTQNALRDSGYTNPSIDLTGGSYCQCVTARVGGPQEAQSFSGVAGVVWANLPGRFNQLEVTVGHLGSRTYTHGQLEEMFGPRPGTLDDNTINQELSSAALTTAAGLGLLALIVVVVGAFTIFGVMRRKRRLRDRQRQLMYATLPPEAWSWVAPGYSLPGEDGESVGADGAESVGADGAESVGVEGVEGAEGSGSDGSSASASAPAPAPHDEGVGPAAGPQREAAGPGAGPIESDEAEMAVSPGEAQSPGPPGSAGS